MIEGDVTLETVTSPVESGTLYIRIQDVSRADAESNVVAEASLSGISLQPGENRRLRFSVDVPTMDPRRQYILTAHLDVSNTGTVTPGDYLTMESIPIDASGAIARVSVPARPVT